jgi:cell division protein YceG involved in septum cleavage
MNIQRKLSNKQVVNELVKAGIIKKLDIAKSYSNSKNNNNKGV